MPKARGKIAREKPAPSARLAALRIHSAAIRVLRGVRRQDLASGLGQARLSALSVLVFQGPLSLKALAEAEQVRPPTMSRIVGALARAGLARLKEAPLDGRAWRIEATEKGQAALKRARERRVLSLARRLAGLTAREHRTIAAAAGLLERAMRGR